MEWGSSFTARRRGNEPPSAPWRRGAAESWPPPTRTSSTIPAPPPVQVLQIAAWLLCPALFVAACWAMLLAPSVVGRWLPRPRQSWLLGGVVAGKDAAFPIELATPVSPYKTWRLGCLLGRLQGPAAGADATPLLAEGSGYSADTRALLAEAAALLRVATDQLDGAQLAGLGATLQALEEHQGPAARVLGVLGVLSAVNLLWGIAILGMALSAGPAAVALSARLCRPLLAALAPIRQVAALVARLLWASGFRPYQLWELAAYSACAYIIGAAERYPDDVAAYVAINGWLLSAPVFLYFKFMHVPARVELEHVAALFCAFQTAAMLPVAACHNPQCMGPLGDAVLFGVAAVSVVPSEINWQVGFEGGESLRRSAVTSSAMLSILAWYGVYGHHAPFQLGFSTSLGIFYFQAGLFRTALINWADLREGPLRRYHYLGANLLYLGVTCGALAIGTWLQLSLLTNTAVTFLVTWVCEKVVENMGGRKMWFRIFCTSLALSQVALFLEFHSEWLTSLLQ